MYTIFMNLLLQSQVDVLNNFVGSSQVVLSELLLLEGKLTRQDIVFLLEAATLTILKFCDSVSQVSS